MSPRRPRPSCVAPPQPLGLEWVVADHLEQLRLAEARLAKRLAEGKRPTIRDHGWITTFPDPLVSIASLERLADIASDPSVRAELLADGLGIRARAAFWSDFESCARRAFRTLRLLPRWSGKEPSSLVSRPEDSWRTTHLLLRSIALHYARYLRLTGRVTHARRVLRRVARMDHNMSKHLAATELGLCALQMGDLDEAARYFGESVDVPDPGQIVLGLTAELQQRLEATSWEGSTPSAHAMFRAARSRLSSIRSGRNRPAD